MKTHNKVREEASSWYNEKPTEYFRYCGPRAYFIDGAVCGATLAMRLTEAEWAEKREQVARAMWCQSEWDISARCGNAIKPWYWLTDEARGHSENRPKPP